MPPRFSSCPICSQQFGSASLDIHIPQCYDKRVKRWEQLPPRDRGPRPQMPPRSMWGGAGSQASGGIFTNPVPQRQCPLGGPPAMSVASVSGRAFDVNAPAVPNYSALAKCRFCGRTFAPDRVGKHQSVCSESKGPRKTFDSSRQRLRDLDDAGGGASMGGGRRSVRGGRGGPAAGGAAALLHRGGRGTAKQQSSWRQQHEAFQRMIRDARQHAPPPRPVQVAMSRNHPYQQAPATGARRFYGSQGAPAHSGSRPAGFDPTAGLGGARRPTSRGGGARSTYGGGLGGGGGAMILPTNETSSGMLEALGRSHASPFAATPTSSSQRTGPSTMRTVERGAPPASGVAGRPPPTNLPTSAGPLPSRIAPPAAALPPRAAAVGRARYGNSSSSEMLQAFGY